MKDTFVDVHPLDLRAGDSVLTAKGTFTVLKAGRRVIEVAWLETGKTGIILAADVVYGPVEVFRR